MILELLRFEMRLLGFDNVGGNLYMAYQQQKERLAGLTPIGTFSALGIGGI